MSFTDSIDTLTRKLQEFEIWLYSELERIIKANELYIITANTDDQLFDRGVNTTEERIKNYRPYRPLTIKIKTQKGQPTDRVTLSDTGDFHRSFKILYHPESFEFIATDWKTEDLKRKYGKNILGLTDSNLNEITRNIIMPSLMPNLLNYLIKA